MDIKYIYFGERKGRKLEDSSSAQPKLQTWNSARAMLFEDFHKSAESFMEKNASESGDL